MVKLFLGVCNKKALASRLTTPGRALRKVKRVLCPFFLFCETIYLLCCDSGAASPEMLGVRFYYLKTAGVLSDKFFRGQTPAVEEHFAGLVGYASVIACLNFGLVGVCSESYAREL